MATQIAPSALLREAAVSDKHLRAHWDDMKKAMGVIRKASVTFGKLCAKMQARELHKYIRKPGSRKGYISFAEYIDNVTGGEISHTTLHVSIALYKLTEGPNALTSDDVAEMPTQNAYALATKLRPTQRTPDIIEAAKKTPTREFAAKVQETLNHNLSPGEQQIVRLPFFRKLHPTVRDKLEDTIERFMQLPVVRDGDLSLTVQEKAIYAICNAAEQFASEDLDAARLTLSPETLGRPDAGDTEDYSPPGPEEIAPGLKNANYSKKERLKTGGGISDGKRCQRECDQPVSRESSFSHDGSRIRRRPYQ